MALKQTTNQMKNLLAQISQDIDKSEAGNRAAAQRVRTGTIRLEKVAKLFRKESIKTEKQTKGKKKPAAKAKTTRRTAKTTTVAKKKSTVKPAAKKAAAPKRKAAKPKTTTKKKTTTRKTTARAPTLSFKRKPTAKLPMKRKATR
ncbi:MAG: histone [Waddliaceae bacterium]